VSLLAYTGKEEEELEHRYACRDTAANQ